MKSLTFGFIILVFAGCNRDVARTTDFILFNKLKDNRFSTSVTSKQLQKQALSSGTKWVQTNIEGRNYQLPRPCVQEDLQLFFQGQRLKNKPANPDQKNKMHNKSMVQMEDKAYDDKGEEINLTLEEEDKKAPKVGQYSFFKFIDDQRVVFVSNNRVKYNKYTPDIKADRFDIDLAKTNNSNPYQRGYYEVINDSTIVIELRQHTKEASKLLYFTYKNDNLTLEKIETFVIRKRNGEKVQESDREIILADNLPDIDALPVAYPVDKEVNVSFVLPPTVEITNKDWFKSAVNIRMIKDGSIYIRQYLDFDEKLLFAEPLYYLNCLSW